MKTIAFFNNKGGVGKTSLVYHLSWMMSLLGTKTIVADLDPQANATSMFLSDDQIEQIWDDGKNSTVYRAIGPLMEGIGDVSVKAPYKIDERLWLIPGDLALSGVEDELSTTWPKCLDGDARSFRVTTAFNRIIRESAAKVGANLALIDVGPNLGAINRCSLVAADYVVIPLSADLFAIRGLQNVGPKLREWRQAWQKRLQAKPATLSIDIPSGKMTALGYVVSRYSVLSRGPVKAFQRWLERAPAAYSRAVDNSAPDADLTIENDPRALALLKDYRSLMPIAQEARKPMFLLKPADGAIGGHFSAVSECRSEFEILCRRILKEIEFPAP
ncbi:MAG: ParA family protein [Beijerinckiaceae bacterium]